MSPWLTDNLLLLQIIAKFCSERFFYNVMNSVLQSLILISLFDIDTRDFLKLNLPEEAKLGTSTKKQIKAIP